MKAGCVLRLRSVHAVASVCARPRRLARYLIPLVSHTDQREFLISFSHIIPRNSQTKYLCHRHISLFTGVPVRVI